MCDALNHLVMLVKSFDSVMHYPIVKGGDFGLEDQVPQEIIQIYRRLRWKVNPFTLSVECPWERLWTRAADDEGPGIDIQSSKERRVVTTKGLEEASR